MCNASLRSNLMEYLNKHQEQLKDEAREIFSLLTTISNPNRILFIEKFIEDNLEEYNKLKDKQNIIWK